jgi:hypothetical protein
VIEQPPTIARPIIEDCRRDIAAARLHIEAMRAILAGSRWLLQTWDERRRADAITGGIRLPAYDEKRASGFVEVEEPQRPRGRRRRKQVRAARPGRANFAGRA